MYNTIALWKGTAVISNYKFEEFEHGDAIVGLHGKRELLKKWQICDFTDARKELEKYSCEYRIMDGTVIIEEYGLEYYTTNEDGDFIEGSDFDFAKTVNQYQVIQINDGVELKLDLFDTVEEAFDYIQQQYAYDYHYGYNMEKISYWIGDLLTGAIAKIKWKEMLK